LHAGRKFITEEKRQNQVATFQNAKSLGEKKIVRKKKTVGRQTRRPASNS